MRSLDQKRLREPNDFYGWTNAIAVHTSTFALCFVAYLTWAYVSPWAILLLAPFLGAQVYKITIVMHDCCHGSLFSSKATNTWVGTVSGFMIGTDFGGFCQQHWRHHSTYGADEDPQGDDYLHLENAARSALVWHLLRPLIGYNLWKLFLFKSNKSEDATQSASSKRGVFLIGTVSTQLLIAGTATGMFSVPWLVLFYPACAATFALFFSQVRGFVEHVAMPGISPVRHARTHLPNAIDKLFFYTLNFNYHIEHHKYPNVPSCNLPVLHERMKNDPGYGDVSSSVIKTVVRRMAARHEQQGTNSDQYGNLLQ